MTTRTRNIRATVAAVAVAAAAGATAMITGGTASAATASTLPCTADQFTVELVPGHPGAGNRYAAIQLTGKEGERCSVPGRLPVDLVGARDVLLENDARPDAPAVGLTGGVTAYAQLHWTGIESAAEQETPNAISVIAPSASNPHGDPVDATVTLPWDLGPVDASRDTHTITVGPLTPGTFE